MLREIVLDTETTGVNAAEDRIVEIGCVELLNHIPTGERFHRYLNPGRPVHPDAVKVHGLTDAFLADKPGFGAVAEELKAFLAGGRLVIHNAAFDVGFLNAEFARLDRQAAPIALGNVVDTLALARRKHPGASNSLDALCARYGIDNARRTLHGALLDAQILAEVYIELIGGKQADLGLTSQPRAARPGTLAGAGSAARAPRAFVSRLTDAERAAHAEFVATLGEGALWRAYLGGRDG